MFFGPQDGAICGTIIINTVVMLIINGTYNTIHNSAVTVVGSEIRISYILVCRMQYYVFLYIMDILVEGNKDKSPFIYWWELIQHNNRDIYNIRYVYKYKIHKKRVK